MTIVSRKPKLVCQRFGLRCNTSFLLAAMVMGCSVANLAHHHTRPFHAVEGIEWPFMVLFFLLAGASLDAAVLTRIGFIGLGYVIFRIIGRFLGAWTGGMMAHAEPLFKKWMGMALMPQAGVALGMALIAVQRRPDLSEIILPIVIASTVFFELIGPVMTRLSLVRAKEIKG